MDRGDPRAAVGILTGGSHGYLKVRRGMCRPDSRSRGLEFVGLRIRLSRATGQNRARIKYPGAVEFTPYKSELQEYEDG